MPQPLVAGLPPDLVLSAGYVVRLTALDPASGAVVSGVTVADVSFMVRPLTTGDVDGAPMPLLVPSAEPV